MAGLELMLLSLDPFRTKCRQRQGTLAHIGKGSKPASQVGCLLKGCRKVSVWEGAGAEVVLG